MVRAAWPHGLGELPTHREVTDTYLLALARAHHGQLASLDRRLVADAVPEGATHLHLIE